MTGGSLCRCGRRTQDDKAVSCTPSENTLWKVQNVIESPHSHLKKQIVTTSEKCKDSPVLATDTLNLTANIVNTLPSELPTIYQPVALTDGRKNTSFNYLCVSYRPGKTWQFSDVLSEHVTWHSFLWADSIWCRQLVSQTYLLVESQHGRFLRHTQKKTETWWPRKQNIN